jgi:hypothetical protein
VVGTLGSLAVRVLDADAAPHPGPSPSVTTPAATPAAATDAVLQLLPCATVREGSCAARVEWVGGGGGAHGAGRSPSSTTRTATTAAAGAGETTSDVSAPWYVRGSVTVAVGAVRAVHPPRRTMAAAAAAAAAVKRAMGSPAEVEVEGEGAPWGACVAATLTQVMAHTAEASVEMGPCWVAALATPQCGDGGATGTAAVVMGVAGLRCLLAHPLGAAAIAKAAKAGVVVSEGGERCVTGSVVGVCTATVRGADRRDVFRRYGDWFAEAAAAATGSVGEVVPPFTAQLLLTWRAVDPCDGDLSRRCRLEVTARVAAMQLRAGGAEAAAAAAALDDVRR